MKNLKKRGFKFMVVEKIDGLSYPVSRHTTRELAEKRLAFENGKGIDRRGYYRFEGEIIECNKRKSGENRFEIDANISKALTKAAKFGFIDVIDTFSAGTEFDGDFRLVAEWLMGVLYAIRRSSNPDERKEVQGHIDDFYKSIQR